MCWWGVLTTLLGVLDDEAFSVNLRLWALSYMVTQSWNCPITISDHAITCLEPWTLPLASWQAVVHCTENYCQCQCQLPTLFRLAPSPLYDRDRTGTISGTVLARNNVGPVTEHFFVPEPEHAKYSLFLVRLSWWSHLVIPYRHAHTTLRSQQDARRWTNNAVRR